MTHGFARHIGAQLRSLAGAAYEWYLSIFKFTSLGGERLRAAHRRQLILNCVVILVFPIATFVADGDRVSLFTVGWSGAVAALIGFLTLAYNELSHDTHVHLKDDEKTTFGDIGAYLFLCLVISIVFTFAIAKYLESFKENGYYFAAGIALNLIQSYNYFVLERIFWKKTSSLD